MISDLKSRKWWNVSSRAVRAYGQGAKPDPRLVIIPQGYGISPSDRKVLIGMDLIYISVPSAELASKVSETYHRWWYVVASSSGRILHVYRKNKPPSCWWAY